MKDRENGHILAGDHVTPASGTVAEALTGPEKGGSFRIRYRRVPGRPELDWTEAACPAEELETGARTTEQEQCPRAGPNEARGTENTNRDGR